MTTAPNRSAGATARNTESSPTLAETAYVALKQQIIAGTLEPGSPLRLEALKTTFGLGFTPLREALTRLTSEGFVEINGLRGFRVAPVTLQKLEDTMQRRIEIEALAVTRALERGNEDWEARIIANFHRLSRRPRIDPETNLISSAWDSAHHSFHYSIVEGCDSPWLLHFWQLLFDQSHRYRQVAVTRGMPYRDDHQEHQELVDALLDRDLKRVLTASRKHIDSTYKVVLKVLPDLTQS